MKKYKVLIYNSITLLVSAFALSELMSSLQSIVISSLCIIVVLTFTTAAMITLKNFNYKGFTDIPTWKHIRNLFIYVIAVILGSLCGYLL